MFLSNLGKVNGMLLRFKFSNYRCFADETVFDMTATSIKEHKDSLIEIGDTGVYVLPVAAFYGANASGKSSFFMAFNKMRSIITQENIITKDNQKLSNTTPFIFHDKKKGESSEYETCIAIGEYEYRYGFECDRNKILCEYLYKRKISKNTTIEKIVFEREGRVVNPGSIINKELKAEIEYCGSMCSDNSLLLTDFGKRAKCKELFNIFILFHVCFSEIEENYFISISEQFAGHTFIDNSQKELYDMVILFLKETDPCIIGIKPHKEKNAEGDDVYSLKVIRKCNEKKYETSFAIESDGTKKFLSLLIWILTAFKYGFPCFIDELDAKLHPLLLRRIIKMFKDKNINKYGAQLIFSAHNIINLDSSDLRRDEIWFVEKSNQKSEIFSLYDFEDEDGAVRSDLSFGKHYLAGRFGAIPFQNEDGRK